MTKYILDKGLPSHGRRAKADNAGTVRVRISRRAGNIFLMGLGPEEFDLYLNISPALKTYHATLEYAGDDSRKNKIQDIEVPSEVLDGIVTLSQDKKFMSLKNLSLSPELLMLDGNDVVISVKSDSGNLTLEDNMLEDTLWNGIIRSADGDIQTPLHKLAAVAFELLGIEPEEYDEEDIIDP